MTGRGSNQRFNMARKEGWGIQYTIEVYVPVRGHGTRRRKAEEAERVLGQLRKDIEEFRFQIKNKNGIVRIYKEC